MSRTKSGSWYAVGMDGMVGQGRRPMWFSTADEARKAVDRFALGNSGMQLIGSDTYATLKPYSRLQGVVR